MGLWSMVHSPWSIGYGLVGYQVNILPVRSVREMEMTFTVPAVLLALVLQPVNRARNSMQRMYFISMNELRIKINSGLR